MRRGSLPVFVLVALGLLLPACGNGEESTVWESPPTVSEADGATMLEEVAPVEVDYQPVPTVEVEAVIDAASGVDVHVTTTGFTINPSPTPTDPVDGEGHFILYVDGAASMNTRSTSRYQRRETTRSGSCWRATTWRP